MKTKNNLTTGVIIGICVIVLPLILMGTTYTTEKQNKWEFHQVETHNNSTGKENGYLLNTEDGVLYFVNGSKKKLCE